MKAPAHEILTFGRDGSYKIATKRFWLVSGTYDAYGKKICEGDRVLLREDQAVYPVTFDGDSFVLVDGIGALVYSLADCSSNALEIVGHITDEEVISNDD